MKKIILAIAALTIGSTTAIAQDNSYGIIAGYNASKIDNVGGTGFSDNRGGFHAGFIAEFGINQKWAWEATVMYSEEGEAFVENGTNTDIKYTNINIPVQAKYYITNGLSVHGGPQVGFITKIELDNGNGPQEIVRNVNSHFALTAGLGYDLDMGLFAKVSLAHGLTDTVQNRDFTNRERISTVHFSLGYKF